MREITWLVGTSSSDIECVHFFGWSFGKLPVYEEDNKRSICEIAVSEDLRVFIWKGDTLYVFPNLEEAEKEFGKVLKQVGVREYLKSINRI